MQAGQVLAIAVPQAKGAELGTVTRHSQGRAFSQVLCAPIQPGEWVKVAVAGLQRTGGREVTGGCCTSEGNAIGKFSCYIPSPHGISHEGFVLWFRGYVNYDHKYTGATSLLFLRRYQPYALS